MVNEFEQEINKKPQSKANEIRNERYWSRYSHYLDNGMSNYEAKMHATIDINDFYQDCNVRTEMSRKDIEEEKARLVKSEEISKQVEHDVKVILEDIHHKTIEYNEKNDHGLLESLFEIRKEDGLTYEEAWDDLKKNGILDIYTLPYIRKCADAVYTKLQLIL